MVPQVRARSLGANLGGPAFPRTTYHAVIVLVLSLHLHIGH
jgi:hypothetical protein